MEYIAESLEMEVEEPYDKHPLVKEFEFDGVSAVKWELDLLNEGGCSYESK